MKTSPRLFIATNSSDIITSAPALLTVTPATSTLTVTSSDVAAAATIDLTAQGTLDWAARGLSLPTDFDDKAGQRGRRRWRLLSRPLVTNKTGA
jgi:hypothetical protein